MARVSSVPIGVANAACGISCGEASLTQALSAVARDLFAKPYRALVDLLGISERDAHYRLSGRRKYTAQDVARLLQSEEGIHFLVALMEQARPKWWRIVQTMVVIGSAEQRRQSDLQLMLKVMRHNEIPAPSRLSDSVRPEDADIFGPVLAGLDAVAGAGCNHRAVVLRRRN